MRAGFRAETAAALRAGLPVAVLLALTVGLAVAIGANLSNATPSEEQPYGWPGAANFEGGVATVRPELVLATTLPALLLGLRSMPRQAPWRGGTGTPRPLAAVASGFVLAPTSILAATLLGAWAAAKSPSEAYFAFWAAHTLLALSCFSIGLLARAATPRHGALAALSTWSLFVVLQEGFVRWRLFRSEGYNNLAAGILPGWFYALQILSPVAAYRALLIIWRPGFRDWVEHAALDNATLPPWLTPVMVSAAIAFLWVAIPLGIALVVLWLRDRRGATAPLLPVTSLGGAGMSSAAQGPVLAASPRGLVEVVAHRPDRPPPVGPERRPRLNAEERAATLRASMRPARPRRRP